MKYIIFIRSVKNIIKIRQQIIQKFRFFIFKKVYLGRKSFFIAFILIIVFQYKICCFFKLLLILSWLLVSLVKHLPNSSLQINRDFLRFWILVSNLISHLLLWRLNIWLNLTALRKALILNLIKCFNRPSKSTSFNISPPQCIMPSLASIIALLPCEFSLQLIFSMLLELLLKFLFERKINQIPILIMSNAIVVLLRVIRYICIVYTVKVSIWVLICIGLNILVDVVCLFLLLICVLCSFAL